MAASSSWWSQPCHGSTAACWPIWCRLLPKGWRRKGRNALNVAGMQTVLGDICVTTVRLTWCLRGEKWQCVLGNQNFSLPHNLTLSGWHSGKAASESRIITKVWVCMCMSQRTWWRCLCGWRRKPTVIDGDGCGRALRAQDAKGNDWGKMTEQRKFF